MNYIIAIGVIAAIASITSALAIALKSSRVFTKQSLDGENSQEKPVQSENVEQPDQSLPKPIKESLNIELSEAESKQLSELTELEYQLFVYVTQQFVEDELKELVEHKIKGFPIKIHRVKESKENVTEPQSQENTSTEDSS